MSTPDSASSQHLELAFVHACHAELAECLLRLKPSACHGAVRCEQGQAQAPDHKRDRAEGHLFISEAELEGSAQLSGRLMAGLCCTTERALQRVEPAVLQLSIAKRRCEPGHSVQPEEYAVGEGLEERTDPVADNIWEDRGAPDKAHPALHEATCIARAPVTSVARACCPVQLLHLTWPVSSNKACRRSKCLGCHALRLAVAAEA
eukprot:2668576-Rhodomonas_salina.1